MQLKEKNASSISECKIAPRPHGQTIGSLPRAADGGLRFSSGWLS